ncbi:uncharacterized protein BX663DRAFT_578076, partial [Cokeromyces recurvatus]|uniref:uncharacterized protein n=1 Tax=Cokeromyces recurvatus TaxID=90255 RepID=UPI002220EEFC
MSYLQKMGKVMLWMKVGNMHFKMDIDTEAYPIDYTTNYDKHLYYKSHEKKTKQKKNLTMKNEAYMRSLIIKKRKMRFVHIGNMAMLSKNNCF